MTLRHRRGVRRGATALLLALTLVGVVGVAPAFAAFVYTNDQGGANDTPGDGQRDLTRHGVDTALGAGHLGVAWSWDETGLSGSNTADACALFDTDADGNANSALCVTVGGDPLVHQQTRAYTCGDERSDRCTQAQSLVATSSTCTVGQTATDPFASGDEHPDDTTAECDATLADLGAGAQLLNTCSYPSEQPNSAPEDCVLDVAPTADVTKTATPGTVVAPGGPVDFEVVVANTSGEQVTVTALTDSVYGDLNDAANPNVANNTCAVLPVTLAADDNAAGGADELRCSFRAAVTGVAGDMHTNTITATVEDDDGNDAMPTGSATVAVVAIPPPPGPGPGPGPCVPIDDDGPMRVEGVTRVETAIAVSQVLFCDGEADGVVLTRSDLFPDAQAGTPLAILKDAAMLLSEPASLNPATETEIQRVLPAGGTVYLLGGTAALSQAVEDRIVELGYVAVRYGGANRFGTAAIIADEGLGNPDTLLAANGGRFADSVVAGAASLAAGGGTELAAVILTSDENIPPETADYLASRSDDPRTIAIGGAAARAFPEVEGIFGATRFETAVMVAERFLEAPRIVGLATGVNFADALTGGTLIGRLEIGPGAMLLTDPADLPDAVAAYLIAHRDTIRAVLIFGGTGAVSVAVEQEAEDSSALP